MVPARYFSKKTLFIVFAVAMIVLAVIIRIPLISVPSNYDLDVYLLPWFDHISRFGLHGFKDNFANYNLPYLYLLLVASKFGLPAFVAIKLVSVIFDFVLAASVALVVRHFRPGLVFPVIAGIVTLFLPVLLLNGSFWGQCDAIYTSFIVLSFWAVLKQRPYLIWLFWGIAFSFKLQAVFFLPVLVFVWLTFAYAHRRGMLAPLLAAIVFFIPFLPALAAGRSFTSILGIYANQAGSAQPLSVNAANVYQWLDDYQYVTVFKVAGVVFTLAVVIAIGAAALVRLRERARDGHLVVLTALILWAVPFFLPTMHERYFFPAEIFLVIAAFVVSRRYIVLAALAQIGTVFAYMPFLFHAEPVALGVIAGVEAVFIAVLLYDAFFAVDRRTIPYLRPS